MKLALERIHRIDGVRPGACSNVYLTQPQGDRDQPWFANQVAEVLCSPKVAPHRLLARLLDIEKDLGRVRDQGRRYGPRVIDLDLLLYGETVLDTPELILPHPRMAERAFVLAPLAEMAPLVMIPGRGRAGELLKSMDCRIEGRRIWQD